MPTTERPCACPTPLPVNAILTALLIAAMTSCHAGSPPPEATDPAGPSTRNGVSDAPTVLVWPSVEEEAMEALLFGRLEIEGTCLRVIGDGEGKGVTPVWPAGHSIRPDAAGTLELIGPEGTVIAAIGDRMRLSGGEVRGADAFPEPLRGAARECPAPYWIVGPEIERAADG